MESKSAAEKEIKNDDNIHEVIDEDEDDHTQNENLKCRFYRKDFPEENDLVIVRSLRLSTSHSSP